MLKLKAAFRMCVIYILEFVLLLLLLLNKWIWKSGSLQVLAPPECRYIKGRLVRPFQHCIRRLIVLLPPNEFLHSSPEAPRTIQERETSASEGRNYYKGI